MNTNTIRYTLVLTSVLTSLLFLSCSGTTPSTKETTIIKKSEKIIATTQAISQTPNSIQANNTEFPSISFITDKSILENGLMHINAFMGSLQPTLKSLLASDSTHQTAMGACSSMAQGMTADYNKQTTDVKIRRTAIKYRNPKNKPDKADIMVMDTFISNQKFEPLLIKLENNNYRVYKPLKVKQSCLLCHGARNDISPTLVKMIDRNYPKDRATGFQLGEFRGVVVAEVKK